MLAVIYIGDLGWEASIWALMLPFCAKSWQTPFIFILTSTSCDSSPLKEKDRSLHPSLLLSSLEDWLDQTLGYSPTPLTMWRQSCNLRTLRSSDTSQLGIVRGSSTNWRVTELSSRDWESQCFDLSQWTESLSFHMNMWWERWAGKSNDGSISLIFNSYILLMGECHSNLRSVCEEHQKIACS